MTYQNAVCSMLILCKVLVFILSVAFQAVNLKAVLKVDYR